MQATDRNSYFPAGTDLFIQNEQRGFRELGCSNQAGPIYANQMLTFGVFEHVNYFGIYLIPLSLSIFISYSLCASSHLWQQFCFCRDLTKKKLKSECGALKYKLHPESRQGQMLDQMHATHQQHCFVCVVAALMC